MQVFFTVLLFVFLYSACAFANDIDKQTDKDEIATCSTQQIDQIKNYVEKLNHVALKFTHYTLTSNNTGVLILQKPYDFRLNYDEPYPLLVVGTKNFISMYDYDLEELSKIDASSNDVTFLLMDTISDDKYEIVSCFMNKDRIGMDLLNKSNNIMSNIYFTRFPKDKLKIESMTIHQSDGTNDDVVFDEIVSIKTCPKSLFTLHHYNNIRRYSTQELIEMCK